MGAFYSVKCKGAGDIVIRARDPDAKQTIFGWGSDRRPSIEFYGRQVQKHVNPDRAVWEWQLSPSGFIELQRNLVDQLKRPAYFNVTPKESLRARELLTKLRRVAKTCKR